MKKKKNRDISFGEIIKHNAFAIKMIWQISPKRVVHMAIQPLIGYFTWMFYSTYFIRYIVNAIETEQPFNRILLYIVIISIITMVFQLYSNYVSNVTVPLDDVKVYSEFYKKLYKKAENVELACFENSEFYNKYTMALDNACDRITGVVSLIFNILAGLSAGVFTYIAMYKIDKMMLVFIISPLIGNFIFGTLLNKVNFRAYQESTPNNRRTEYVNRVMYLSDYAKEIRLSNIFNVLKNTFNKAVSNNILVAKKYKNKKTALSFFQYYFSFTIIFEGVLLYGVYCVLVSKSMTAGELAVLTSMMTVGSWVLIGVTNNIMQLGQNGMYMYNIRSFLTHMERIPEDWDGAIPDNKITSIEMRNVSFSYNADTGIIKNLSFRIEQGKSVALVGHNGAGKTTIIKLLLRFYDPTEGEIFVNNINIKEYNLKEYRSLFAAAFQDYKIFAGTVAENVHMGNHSSKSEEEISNALKYAGVYDKVAGLKNGINTVLTKEFDEDGAILSGGEAQKIVVARAFANPAPIKIFDEPSSALDPIAEYKLFESILEKSKGHITIFISHRLSSVKNANEVFMLENGEIIEKGTHIDLMRQGGKYADMFIKQAENYQPDENKGELNETKKRR